jgi:hypothetical protein
VPRPNERAEAERLEADLDRRLRRLEEPEYVEITFGFDPTPVPSEVSPNKGSAPVVPAEKRIDADGRLVWVLRVEVLA